MKHQLALAIIIISSISFGVGNMVGAAVTSTDDDTASPVRNPNNPLQVKPAAGDPIPLSDFTLQGAESSQQQAEGGLQNPQTADDLQPNANTDLFPDDL